MVLVAHLAYRRPRPGFWPAWFLTLVIAIAYAVSVERNSSNVADTDGTLINALVFFALLQAWPQSSVLADLVLAGLVSAGLVKLWSRPESTEARGTLAGVGMYAVLNAGLIALNREPASGTRF